jgi:hypothetical protein
VNALAPLLALLVSVAPPPWPDDVVPPMPSSGLVDTHQPLATTELRIARFRIVHTAQAKGPAEFLAKEIEGIRDEVAQTIGRDWPGVTELRLGFGGRGRINRETAWPGEQRRRLEVE